MITFNDDNLRDLGEYREKQEEDLARTLSAKYGVSYANLSGIPIESDALRTLPEAEARASNVAPFAIAGMSLKVGVISPNEETTKAALKKLEDKGYKLDIYMVSHKSLEKAWGRYEDVDLSEVEEAGVVTVSKEALKDFESKFLNNDTLAEYIRKSIAEDVTVTETVDTLLQAAIVQGASDIHIEPQEDTVQIRMRIDGVLVPITDIDALVHKRILSRIKILSGLKLNVQSEPQDGRFSIEAGEADVEVRTSIIPGAFGESVVMRLLNPDATNVSIDNIGIDEILLSKIREELTKPNGMILTTGPTGSGKTTALYAFMKEVYKPGIKIITIENPVEYRLAGIVQTQVDKEKGYDFYDGLRSSLRQDPDVIMVGEIRDDNTAKTAVQAALTGHLVFSTLHTNDAVGAIPRMRDLGVKEDVLGSALNIILAQRLVRKLKPDATEDVPMTDRERTLIETIMKDVDATRWKHLFERGMLKKPKEGLKDHEAYSGRTAIFEAIVVDQEVEDLIREGASLIQIDEKGRKKYGILALREHGVLNVLNGLTDLQELERVVSLLG